MAKRDRQRGGIRPRIGLWIIVFLLLAGGAFWWWIRDPFDREYGSFEGQVTARWDEDGRNMTLVQDFAYIDPHGKQWLAKTGSMINGASIPRIFWSVIGGPFEGKFRNASVVHDAACEVQSEPWQDVHRMLYDACRCSRVGEGKAQTMYWAVYQFGPRWQRVEETRIENGQPVTVMRLRTEQPPEPAKEVVAKAERYFSKQRLSPAEIEACTVEDIESAVAKWDEK